MKLIVWSGFHLCFLKLIQSCWGHYATISSSYWCDSQPDVKWWSWESALSNLQLWFLLGKVGCWGGDWQAVSAVTLTLYQSVVVEREPNQEAKLCLHQSISFVDQWFQVWGSDQTMRTQIQAAETHFLHMVAAFSVRKKFSHLGGPGVRVYQKKPSD